MLSHQVKSITTFDLGKMSNKENGYDHLLPHPARSEIEFVSWNGTKTKLLVAQVATLVAIANLFTNPGRAIDAMFEASKAGSDEIAKICNDF